MVILGDGTSILDIIDYAIAEETARRTDAVGQMVHAVLMAGSPDGVFETLARAYVTNQNLYSRRRCITQLAEAFGAQRTAMKKWLRSKGIVGEMD